MKKLVALVLALVMVMGMTVAIAEEKPASYYTGVLEAVYASDDYDFPEGNITFIEKNLSLFTKKSTVAPSTALINRSFSVPQFKKNPSPYVNKLIEVENLKVFQAFSYPINGVTFDYIGCSGTDGMIYWLWACYDTGLVEDMYIEKAYVLPSDYISYTTVSNNTKWAIVGILSGAGFNTLEGRQLFVYKQANVRSGAGTNYSALGFAYGTYTCVDEVYGGGVLWYKIKYNNGYGYVASSTAYYK